MLRRRAGEGSEHGRRSLGVPREMSEDFLDHYRIFDARDDLDGTTTVLAGQDVDLDQIAWSDSEPPQAGPQGAGQDARSNPAAFASELLSSAAAIAGTVCKVNALRPWWGPSAMR
jgi:hypothetical protein